MRSPYTISGKQAQRGKVTCHGHVARANQPTIQSGALTDLRNCTSNHHYQYKSNDVILPCTTPQNFLFRLHNYQAQCLTFFPGILYFTCSFHSELCSIYHLNTASLATLSFSLPFFSQFFFFHYSPHIISLFIDVLSLLHKNLGYREWLC